MFFSSDIIIHNWIQIIIEIFETFLTEIEPWRDHSTAKSYHQIIFITISKDSRATSRFSFSYVTVLFERSES